MEPGLGWSSLTWNPFNGIERKFSARSLRHGVRSYGIHSMELKDVEYIVACGSINVAVHGIHSMELKVFDSPKVSDTTSVST